MMPLYSGAIVVALTQQLAQAEAALDRVRLFRDQCAADTGIEVTFTRQDVAAHLTAAIEGESSDA